MTTAALIGWSLAGCAWLRHAPRHSVSEILAATSALAPMLTLLLLAFGPLSW